MKAIAVDEGPQDAIEPGEASQPQLDSIPLALAYVPGFQRHAGGFKCFDVDTNWSLAGGRFKRVIQGKRQHLDFGLVVY